MDTTTGTIIKSIVGSVMLSVCVITIVITFMYRKTRRTWRYLLRFPIVPPFSHSGSRSVTLKQLYRQRETKMQRQWPGQQGAVHIDIQDDIRVQRAQFRKGHLLSKGDIGQKTMWKLIQEELTRNRHIYDEFTWSKSGSSCGIVPELSSDVIDHGGWGVGDGTRKLNLHIEMMEQHGLQLEEKVDALRGKLNDMKQDMSARRTRIRHSIVEHDRTEELDLAREISSLQRQLQEQRDTLCHFKDFAAKSHFLLEKATLYRDDETEVLRNGSRLSLPHSDIITRDTPFSSAPQPLGRSTNETIRSHISRLVQRYCTSKEESRVWEKFVEMYEKARFSSEELSRDEYNQFLGTTSNVLRLADKYAKLSIQNMVEKSTKDRRMNHM